MGRVSPLFGISLEIDSAEEILISFKGTEFSGTTGRHSYLGTYKTEDGRLSLFDFAGTEVGESEWGRKYMTSLMESYDPSDGGIKLEFVLEGDLLKIQYAESRLMLFERD